MTIKTNSKTNNINIRLQTQDVSPDGLSIQTSNFFNLEIKLISARIVIIKSTSNNLISYLTRSDLMFENNSKKVIQSRDNRTIKDQSPHLHINIINQINEHLLSLYLYLIPILSSKHILTSNSYINISNLKQSHLVEYKPTTQINSHINNPSPIIDIVFSVSPTSSNMLSTIPITLTTTLFNSTIKTNNFLFNTLVSLSFNNFLI